MAASAATRAALLGLALLALQRSPAGALGDPSPEGGGRGDHAHASTSRTPAESQRHSHHQHVGSGTREQAMTNFNHQPSYDFRHSAKKSISDHPKFDDTEDEEHRKMRRREGEKDFDDPNSKDGASAGAGANAAHSKYMGNPNVIEPPDPGTYIPSNCSSCTFREELRNLSLQSIKEQILIKLGMKHAPNTTGRAIPKIPPLNHLLDLYGMQSDQPDRRFIPGPVVHDEEDDFHAKTTMVIAVAQTTKLRHGGGIGDVYIQHFKFSEHSIRNKVSDASMFIYVPVMPRPVRVLVYRVVGNATEHESMTVLQATSSKFSEQRKPSWVELDAKKLLIDWFKSPQDNLGVVVKIEDDRGIHIPYNIEAFDHNNEATQPFVKVLTTNGRKPRKKRTIGLDCNDNSQETRCCRYPLTVDFEEFGWDWIIAPKRYEANYCSGECPYVFLQKYPHTHIVQQAIPSGGTAGPCCAPRKMSPITMLFFDNEFNIIYGLLPGMVVDRCGCQ